LRPKLLPEKFIVNNDFDVLSAFLLMLIHEV
jgi:hypothetical protein